MQAHRTLGVTCLADCAVAFAASQAAHTTTATGAAFNTRLHRLLDPVLSAAGKGSFSGSAEQLAAVRWIATGCMPHAPLYTIQRFLAGLLAAEPLDVVLVALQAALDIMLASTQRLLQPAAGSATTVRPAPLVLLSTCGCRGSGCYNEGI